MCGIDRCINVSSNVSVCCLLGAVCRFRECRCPFSVCCVVVASQVGSENHADTQERKETRRRGARVAEGGWMSCKGTRWDWNVVVCCVPLCALCLLCSPVCLPFLVPSSCVVPLLSTRFHATTPTNKQKHRNAQHKSYAPW